MADLTLERIAELRTHMELLDQDVFECGSEFAMVTLDSRKLKQLLDAAERGLTSDRKAAAFDRLAALGEFSASEVDGEIVIHFAPCNLFHAPTLLEAIEALPQTNGEPKQ